MSLCCFGLLKYATSLPHYMVKSIYIDYGSVLFIGERVEVWYKIFLLYLVLGIHSSLKCFLYRVPGSHPKSWPESCRKSHPKLCRWISQDIRTYAPSLFAYPVLPPARKLPLITHNLVLLLRMHISSRTRVFFFNTTGTPAVLCVTPLCVLPCLLVQAFSLPTGFLQRLVSMCSATTPLRHDILPFLSSSRPNPCRVEPIVQVTTCH